MHMAPRALASATISFGLVAIPVRLYPAAVSQHASFHLLHVKCGNRIRYQSYCPVDDEVVEPEEIVKGYEISKGEFVRVTEDELERLAGPASKEIEIAEFVPLGSVDPVFFDRAYYLGPDKGGARPYALLHGVLAEAEKAALGRFVLRGKASLVLIRAAAPPVGSGLLLHTMYFHDEVRDLAEVDAGARTKAPEGERRLALRLVDELSRDAFRPAAYEDEHRARVLDFVRLKAKGKALPGEAPRPRRGQVIDLMDALRQSLGRRAEPRAARAGRGGRSAVAGVARRRAGASPGRAGRVAAGRAERRAR